MLNSRLHHTTHVTKHFADIMFDYAPYIALVAHPKTVLASALAGHSMAKELYMAKLHEISRASNKLHGLCYDQLCRQKALFCKAQIMSCQLGIML